MAEGQTRQSEQEARLEEIIFSPQVTPSHALVDLCVNMLEQNVFTWIKPEECTSRSQEIQSLKKDAKVSLDSTGSIKITSKAAATILAQWDQSWTGVMLFKGDPLQWTRQNFAPFVRSRCGSSTFFFPMHELSRQGSHHSDLAADH